jgi:hypothetical protein
VIKILVSPSLDGLFFPRPQSGWTVPVWQRCHNVVMTFNDQFFQSVPVPKPAKSTAENPFRCFDVRCVSCGDKRLILIATFDYDRREVVVVDRIASRKICQCEGPSHRFNRNA